ALERLGRSWHLVESRIAVKPYPSCALTHSAIDALIDLRAQHRLSAGDVAAVQVGVNSVVPDVLAHARPTTALERKFSMQFCAAAALAEGGVDFGSFAEGDVANPDVRELMKRVAMVVDPGLPQGVEQHAWSRVTIRLRDGRTRPTFERRLSAADDPHIREPQQALDDADHQGARGPGDLPKARRDRGHPRGGLPSRSHEAARSRLRDPETDQPAPGVLLALRLRPGRPLSRPAGARHELPLARRGPRPDR